MEEKSLVKYNEPIVLQPDLVDKAEDWEDFVSLWMLSQELDQRNQWFKGDVADKVTIKFGEETLKKFSNDVGDAYQTVVGYRRVARAFEPHKRLLNVPWSTYLIASQTDSWDKKKLMFESDNRNEWVEKAHDNQWSARRLSEEIKRDGAIKERIITAFEAFTGYVEKFSNMVNHWDVAELTESQLKEIRIKLLEIYKAFTRRVIKT